MTSTMKAQISSVETSILDQAPRLEVIGFDHLRESPLNTRKHFDPVKLAELQASIEKSGILTPLLVRPNTTFRNGAGPVYEIAAGHRRFRAGQRAGVAAAPCIVREMDDATFLEVLTIENLQREDVHPLEEAEGYKNLLTLDGYDIKKIAARVGKSESYVYDRMKLLQLIAPAKKLFLAHRFTLAHAILLARLSKDDQQRCLALDDNERLGSGIRFGGLWAPDHGGEHPPLGLDDPTGIAEHDEDPTSRLKPVSVRELQAWVDNHVRFTGPDTETPHLFADTAANLKQATTVAQKVIEISRDHQLKDDAKHPDGKRTYCVTSWARADGQPEDPGFGKPKPSKPCDYSVLGVVVAGRGRGESFQVCTDKKRCTTHWADAIKERNQRERKRDKGEAGPKGAAAPKEQSWEREQRLRREREQRQTVRWAKGGQAVMTAIVQKLKKLPMDSTGAAGKWLWAELLQDGVNGLDDHAKTATKLGIGRGTTAADFMRHTILCAIVADASPSLWSDNEKDLQKAIDALKLKVNVTQLLDAANPAQPEAAPARASTSKKR